MPKLATPLTDIQVKNAEKKAKDDRLTDGGGMYFLINVDGAKYWRTDYRLNDRRNTLGKLLIASITRKVISAHASVASSIAMC